MTEPGGDNPIVDASVATGSPIKDEPGVVTSELTPKLLNRSEQKVAIPASKSEGDIKIELGKTLVIVRGEYTVVVGKGIKEIQIFDHKGRKVPDLNEASVVIVDWPALKEKHSPHQDTISSRAGAGGAYVGQFPTELQDFLLRFIPTNPKYSGQDNLAYIPTSSWELPIYNPSEIEVQEMYGTLMLNDPKNKRFIAFETRTDDGVELPPRNWKRYDTKDLIAKKESPIGVSVLEAIRKKAGNATNVTTQDVAAIVCEDRVVVAGRGNLDQPTFTGADPLFIDNMGAVKRNALADPKNPDVIYYCSSENPHSIIKLDTSSQPIDWHTESLDFPKNYRTVQNLRMDSSGNFFTFQTETDFVVVSKDGLHEIGRIPNVFSGELDDMGNVRAVDQEGYLVTYDLGLKSVTKLAEAQRIQRIASGITDEVFKPETGASHTTLPTEEDSKVLEPIREDLTGKFREQLDSVTNFEGASHVQSALEKVRVHLRTQGLTDAQVELITTDIKDLLTVKQREMAIPLIAQGLTDLTAYTSGTLSVATIGEARAVLTKLKSLESHADDNTRAQIRALEKSLTEQSGELFRREGATVIQDVQATVEGVKIHLETLTSMPDFADWAEFELPQLTGKLGLLARECPIEASEAQRAILDARKRLQEIAREYETRFKQQYATVRERASEVISERTALIGNEIDSVIDRLRGRGFADRAQAQTYVDSSQSLQALRDEIETVRIQNPEAAKELEKALKVRLATTLAEIDRGGKMTVAESGQQMVLFGETLFPKWEAKVKERVERHVDLAFFVDEKTKGPGVSADQLLGDVGVTVINTRGQLERVRLFEGMTNEDQWRYGGVIYKGGEYMSPSYVSQDHYRRIKRHWQDWSKGESSTIRKELRERKEAMRELYEKRQPRGKRTKKMDADWSMQYEALLKEYGTFAANNDIALLNRIDKLKNAPEEKNGNGSGYVPEWQNHWTVDGSTEAYLQEMAEGAKMQLDLQEGLLMLKGHAGTGKDVLIKMFCNRANRPYFTMDCSKWTDEFTLSEDVVLESEDGASKTVKVPSVVLNAITTPGAVMYFNELNAMPEQAQIFLHGLMDEKRTLTLKTSSGKAVKALSSNLLMGSMNPGYPGTYDPQYATRSRMVSMEIGYPSLYRERDPQDPNPNPAISAAEALRIARQVDSLTDFTYDADLTNNEFVKIWDRHINGIENGAPELSPTQKFDLEVVLSMVQFGQKLREGFILKFDKRSASDVRGKLLVDQPLTGRDMRRMAYFLSQMTPEQKATANPETVTRDLMERFFLTHIDNQRSREEVKTAMASWTSSKRPAA